MFAGWECNPLTADVDEGFKDLDISSCTRTFPRRSGKGSMLTNEKNEMADRLSVIMKWAVHTEQVDVLFKCWRSLSLCLGQQDHT